MTDDIPRTVAAGWYEDPDDRGLVRWWNGLAWTDHVEQRPVRVGEPDDVSTAAI